MTSFRTGVRILFLCWIMLGLSSGISKKYKRHTGQATIIRIDPKIKEDFPCVDSLLHEVITNPMGIFQCPDFRNFFSSATTRLFITEKDIDPSKGGQSKYIGKDTNGTFRDSILLNRFFFTRASREYIIAVIVHETMHAFLTWCSVSFSDSVDGVDTAFLKSHCPRLWNFLATGSLTQDKQHMLMADDLFDIMTKNVYFYTNAGLDSLSRDSIARSLTWGGLHETAKWKQLKADTCFFNHVDVWARRMDAPYNSKVDTWKDCKTTYIDFLHHLRLTRLCQ